MHEILSKKFFKIFFDFFSGENEQNGAQNNRSQNEMMCELGELADLDTVNDADPLNLLTDARFGTFENGIYRFLAIRGELGIINTLCGVI